MANSYIEVTHACGHKETHHFTKSASLNRRAAKYKEEELCSKCYAERIKAQREKEVAKKSQKIGESTLASLPEIEAVSEKQKAFAENMRVKKINLITSHKDDIEERLEDAIDMECVTEEEGRLFKETMEAVLSYKKASFWIDELTTQKSMIFSHLLFLTVARNDEKMNNSETIERLSEAVNRGVANDFDIYVNTYLDCKED